MRKNKCQKGEREFGGSSETGHTNQMQAKILKLEMRVWQLQVLFGIAVALPVAFGLTGAWLVQNAREIVVGFRADLSAVQKELVQRRGDVNDLQANIGGVKKSIAQIESNMETANQALASQRESALTMLEERRNAATESIKTVVQLLEAHLAKQGDQMEKALKEGTDEYFVRSTASFLPRLQTVEDRVKNVEQALGQKTINRTVPRYP